MISVFTDRTVYRVSAVVPLASVRIFSFLVASISSPSTIALASLAGFGSTCQFSTFAYLHDDKFPALVQDLLDLCRKVDHLSSGDHFVKAVNVAIEELVVPERIGLLSVSIQIGDVASVEDFTLSSQRRDRTSIRLHRSVYNPSIVDLAWYIPRPKKPIDSQRIYRSVLIVVYMEELHYPG